MTLEWDDLGGDATAKASTGEYLVEQAGETAFWAFADENPLGWYKTMNGAKVRCEEVHLSRNCDS